MGIFENDNDKLGDSASDPVFEFGDEIQTSNYAPLIKVNFLNGITRIVEDEDPDDNYADLLEEGDFEGDLAYVHSDVDGDNKNTIAQNEIDLRNE
jgi:hypothetical protein